MGDKEMIPLGRPDIRQEDIDAMVTVLQSGMLVQGKNVLSLEQAVGGSIKTSYCAATSNGTASLHLALVALGIGRGDEVLVPAFSYIATANMVENVGARCVFVDVDEKTFNIDVAQIEEKITPHTKAIIPVHEFGLCAEMHRVMKIADKHKLFVIEDAACALGATYNGKMAGSFGHFGAFSLHPRKAITSGEGGLVVTSDHALDRKIRILRNHGIQPDSSPMDFVEAGFNYRMTDFQAALVYSQFRRLSEILLYKKKLASLYLKSIVPGKLRHPFVPSGCDHTWQTFHLMAESESMRNALMQHLKEKGIQTNYGAQCIPAMTFYKRKYNLDVNQHFPNAWAAYSQGLAIPLYERLTESQAEHISQIINSFTNDAAR